MAAVVLAAAAGCTATAAPDGAAKTARPRDAVTVVDARSVVERAVDTSRALFRTSPLVVVAPESDSSAQAAAARKADAWGVPMLVAPAPTSTPASSGDTHTLAAEVGRLGATTVATLGDVGHLRFGGATVSAAGDVQHHDATTPPTGGVVAVATQDPANRASIATARAAGATVTELKEGEHDLQGAPDAIAALHSSKAKSTLLIGTEFASTADPAWSVAAARTGDEFAAGGQRLFPANRFVAIYGAPGAPSLGVLGEQGVAQTIARAKQVAAPYAALSDKPVTPMLELIATVAAGAPGADGSYSNKLPADRLEPYIDAAAKAGMYVVLDLQPGRQDFVTQAKRYATLLEKPNVGLALDPEWRLSPTQVPLQQIGRVGADEVNAVSSWLADLVEQHSLPPKMFVLHQFRPDMLQDRGRIVTSHPELETLIHVDGQGSQPDKQATWSTLHADAPAGVAWGWKNFYDEDAPMLTPEQTLAQVRPTPDLVTYQ